MTITAAECQRRREHVDAARANAALEGQRVTPATHDDQEAYVAGAIDLDELGDRGRARHGAHQP